MDDYGEQHDAVLWDSAGEEDVREAEKLMKDELTRRKDSDDDDDDEKRLNDEWKDESDNIECDDDGDNDEMEYDDRDSDLGSELEDLKIRSTDRVLVSAQTDEEYSNLEVYVYDSNESSLYVHHDIALSAFPLCLTWIGCGKSVLGDRATTNSNNYIGVGTFNPEIEVWNLDVLDAIEPTVTLGGRKFPDANGHKNAVLGLDWNSNHNHLLASASGDCTVKLWDLSKIQCVKTFSHHTDKVQCIQWNPVETSVLLSGSFDKKLAVFDANASENTSGVVEIQLNSDVESCLWNPHRPEQVIATTEDGKVSCFDIRNVSAGPLYSFQAHNRKSCSSISFSSRVRGLLATCSPDKSVKLWDIENAAGPKCVGEKLMTEAGSLFDVAFSLDNPFLLAAGGDKGQVAVWDPTEEIDTIERIFKDRFVIDASGVKPQEETCVGGTESVSSILNEKSTARPVDTTSRSKKKKGKK